MQQQELTNEQQEQLKKFQDLSPEEREKVIQQQCIFCQISTGKIDTIKVYEDSDVLAVLDINPATPGHVLIFPKMHLQFLFQLSDKVRDKLFEISSKISIYLVNAVKAKGVNFYSANGPAAGQRLPHFVFHLIPRYDNDGLSFDWAAKQVEKKELEKIAEIIKSNFKENEVGKKTDEESKKKVSKEIKKQMKGFRRKA